MSQHNVFVYGTLKRGYGNNRLLRNSEFVDVGVSADNEFTMYCNGGFPYVFDSGEAFVAGEVYSVTDEVFGHLDGLEGYPRHYDRKQIDVSTKKGIIKCWIYIGQNEESKMADWYERIMPAEVHGQHNTLKWRD